MTSEEVVNGRKKDVFRYERKPMLVRKKDDSAASIFGPYNHPGCDPHAPRTTELPKHTTAM
jgi:hypothetical protein